MPVDVHKTRVREVMTSDVVTIDPDSSVLDAAKLMAAKNVGALPVIDGDGRLVGMLSERDIVRRVVALEKDPARTPVRDAMTPQPVAVKPDYTLADAIRTMLQLNIRHLPVVDEEGNLVGIISVKDIEAAIL